MKPALNRKRILVVDDEPLLLSLLETRLSPRYEVLTAMDGEEALRFARSHRPDLILSDLLMPKMDGAELARSLRCHVETNRIPLVILSALEDTASIRRAQEAGAVDYLMKPVHLTDLPELVARYI